MPLGDNFGKQCIFNKNATKGVLFYGRKMVPHFGATYIFECDKNGLSTVDTENRCSDFQVNISIFITIDHMTMGCPE